MTRRHDVPDAITANVEWRYRDNADDARLLAPSWCPCGVELSASDEYVVEYSAFPRGRSERGVAFYYFCVPCGLDAHHDTESREQRLAALARRAA